MGKILWLVAIFLFIGGYIIVSSQHLDLGEKDDRTGFIKSFGNWLFSLGKSTGNVVKSASDQDWLPDSEEKLSIKNGTQTKNSDTSSDTVIKGKKISETKGPGIVKTGTKDPNEGTNESIVFEEE